ncbi:MobF family relaxase, partial [Burkholderia glumae]
YVVRGMAATGRAALQLAADGGISADTVTMFEIHEQRRQDDLKLLREYVPDMKREPELWLVDETIIITPFNEDRVNINNAIRSQLQARGKLDTQESDHTIFRSESEMTRAKQKEAQYYTTDMTVRFGRDYQKILAARGEYMRVVATRPDEGIVVLRKADGSLMEWEPKKYNRVEIYLSEERALAARDVIRFTRGDELVKNGHEATVVSIQGNQAVLRLADGKEIPWDLDAQRHWDHAYAATVHAGQGATREQAILHIPSEKLGRDPDDPRRQSDIAMTVRRIFGDRSFYVGITRAVDDLLVYTTGAETARWAVSQHQDKSSALQTLREHDEAQQAVSAPQRQRRQQVVQEMQTDPD